MTDITLYSQILGITPPWEITSVELDMDNERVDVYVKWSQKGVAPCPTCEGENEVPIHDLREERVWRHLDTCQIKTFIHCKVPRSKCSKHGVKTINVSWAKDSSRFTILFETFAIKVLQTSLNRSRAAELLKLSWDEINHIMQKAVKRGLSRRKDSSINYLGIDEKSFLKGHNYITVLTDIDNKCIIDIVKDRKEESVDLLLRSLSKNQKNSVKSVCMDFWKPFYNSVSKNIPNADIVHDSFHISKYLNEAVDKVRRQEHSKLLKNKDTKLSGTKYLWLKKQTNWNDKDTARYETLSKLQLSVSRAWERKELFPEFYKCKTIEDAEIFFKKWYFSATHSRLKPIIEVAKMLKRHIEGLLLWIKHKISNGLSEGLNSQIQLIKSIARGFRNFDNYRIAILFSLGGLDLFP